ncbi:MAG: Class I SAM-dependent methyltransferase [Nitrospira sp.]|nr:MAG: Class I SAM-dependent methyltransferase [Nitrospira sp.]
MRSLVCELQMLLDETADQLRCSSPDVPRAVGTLALALQSLREQQSPEVWRSAIESCRAHSLCALVHQDPLTERAFRQPRGYQGDAELLDMIYERSWNGIVTSPVSQLGERVFSYTVERCAPAAVRSRCGLLASEIDRTCDRISGAHILSVACGHLRELHQCSSLQSKRIGRFVGLDQDPLSIEVVNQHFSNFRVETLTGSIKLLFGGDLGRQRFDYIYSAGLFDYLGDALAKRLIERMFRMLRPGGRLLVANFRTGIQDAGYMETFMDWSLIYRDEADMRRLCVDISEEVMCTKRVFCDEACSLVFPQLDRG